jgi:NitT/TauT family transport system ATP-binding protein
MGLQGISAGRIELQGVQGNDIGILFQDDALLPWRTAIENVALGLRLRGRDRRAAVAEGKEWLARLGLAGFEARYPRELSGGQRKRVALAQVLALKPRLLLMDEPFASLDAIVRARVTQDVVDLVEQQGISVLLVTHDLEEAIALSDRVYLLSQGPRAHISQCYTIPIPRPRHLMRARTHPKFGPLLERLWSDLSQAVEGAGPVAEAA